MLQMGLDLYESVHVCTHTHTDKYNFNNRERKNIAPKHTPPHNVRQAPRVL